MDVTGDMMEPTRHATRECLKISQVLARIGDKWSVLVIVRLRAGPLRFNAMRRSIEGISQRMLTLTLRNLERDGLVRRTVTASIPPRVDYALSPLGHSLADPVTALGDWAFRHLAEFDAARARYDGAISADSPAEATTP